MKNLSLDRSGEVDGRFAPQWHGGPLQPPAEYGTLPGDPAFLWHFGLRASEKGEGREGVSFEQAEEGATFGFCVYIVDIL